MAAGLLRDFETHGRLALVPMGLYVLLWVPLNLRMGFGLLSPLNAADILLVLLAASVCPLRTARVRGTVTVLYRLVALWGVLFVWSPGAAG